MKKEKPSHVSFLLRTIILLFCGIVFMLPVILLVLNSFKPYSEMIKSFVTLPTSIYLENFKEAIKIMDFWNVFGNTLFITVLTVVGCVFVSFMAAFGIAHLRGKSSNRFYLFFTLGQIIPFHTIMIAVSVMTTKLHLNNNYFALISLYIGFHCAFGVFTYVGFLKTIPSALEEAAALDGCSMMRTMWSIIFPLVLPTSITVSVLFFLWTWNDFLMPSLLLSDSSLRTITVNMYLFKGAASTEWNLFIASLTMSITPIIIIYIVAQKYITSGITAGAVKQ